MRRVVLAAALAAFVLGSSAPRSARADEAAGAPSQAGPATASPSPQTSAAAKALRAELDGVLAEMRSTSRRVRDQLRTTRQRGTRTQITCVDESLSRSDVALRTARDQADAAVAAYLRGDEEAGRAARVRVFELRAAQRLAAREGAACAVGRLIAAAPAAGTTVKLSVDPRIPPVNAQ